MRIGANPTLASMKRSMKSNGQAAYLALALKDMSVRLSGIEGLALKAQLRRYRPQNFPDSYEHIFGQAAKAVKAKVAAYLEVQVMADHVLMTEAHQASGPTPGQMHLEIVPDLQVDRPMLWVSYPWGEQAWIKPDSEPRAAQSSFRFRLPRFRLSPSSITQSLYGQQDKIIIRWVVFPAKEVRKRKLIQSYPGFREHEFYRLNWDKGDEKWEFIRIKRQADWQGLTGAEPALLLIPGTNGTPKKAFKALLQSEEIADLIAYYGSRIFAFKHPSVAVGVIDNAHELVNGLRGKSFAHLDILTRSRGCLVARWWLEMLDPLPDISVKKLLMLAGPNQGSPSANPDNRLRTFFVNDDLLTLARQISEHRGRKDLLELDAEERAQLEEDLVVQMLRLWQDLYDIIPYDEGGLFQGIEDQSLGSVCIRLLNEAKPRPDPFSVAYYSVSTQLDLDHTQWQGLEADLRTRIKIRLSQTFNGIANDGINPTEGASGDWQTQAISPLFRQRLKAAVTIEREALTHHLNYLQVQRVRQQLVAMLTDQAVKPEFDPFI